MQDKKTIAAFFRSEKRDLLFLLFLIISFIAYGLMNRDWGNARNLSVPVDAQIPLIPESVLIYHLWAPSLFIVLTYLFLNQKQAYRAFLVSIAIGALLAFTTFFFFTTTVQRPDVQPTNLANQILYLTYRVDAPFACFPSYHVLTITLACYFFVKSVKTNLVKSLFILWTILICLSTLTTKQHVLVDLIGGLFYAVPSVIIGKRIEKQIVNKCFKGIS